MVDTGVGLGAGEAVGAGAAGWVGGLEPIAVLNTWRTRSVVVWKGLEAPKVFSMKLSPRLSAKTDC